MHIALGGLCAGLRWCFNVVLAFVVVVVFFSCF